ncbi:MAG TPA: radical SAM protein [Candidatus Woesearchaeota archaeon]|nr:radical SAM protein [Candidatus Woesearchaeota archaeon]
MQKIILATLNIHKRASIHLALYLLKGYFLKHSEFNELVEIEILDFSIQDKKEDIVSEILKKNPEIVGFSCYMWNIIMIQDICKLLKIRDKNLKIILGGPEVSARDKEILFNNSKVDFIVRGEGEKSFMELIECIVKKGDISKVLGVSYRDFEKVFVNEKRENIIDLDEIPSPYLQGLVLNPKYYEGVCTETMRGCPFKCDFCYYHKDFSTVRYHSLERIEKELEFILKRKPMDVYLMDPTFNIDNKRAKDVLRIFIKYNRGSTLHVELKAELLDEEMIILLHKANVNLIEIGIQSINDKTLKLINRHFDMEKFKQNMTLLKRYEDNKNYQISLLDGLPNESYDDFKKSLDFVVKLLPSSILIMVLSLLPGTKLRDNAKSLGIKYEEKSPYHVIETSHLTKEDLEKIHHLRFSLFSLYNNGFMKKSLVLVSNELGISPSTILEDWYRFVDDYSKSFEKKKGLLPMLFLDYLCKYYCFNGDFNRLKEELKEEMLNAGKKFSFDINQQVLKNLEDFKNKRDWSSLYANFKFSPNSS